MNQSARRIVAFVRSDVWATFGIIGLALNLLGAMAPFIALTQIARWIVDHWVDLTAVFWIWLFALIRVDIPPILGFALSFLVFHLGLVASAIRRGQADDPAVVTEQANLSRDRLLCLLLYIPIMIATLFTAFLKLAEATIQGEGPPDAGLVPVAFCLVVASPLLAFSLVRPRKLMRRFLSVYVLVLVILVLNLVGRGLERLGVTRSPF